MVAKDSIRNKKTLVQIGIFSVLMLLIIGGYYIARIYLQNAMYRKVYTSDSEFLTTIDCTPLIDKYGTETEYLVEFEIKTEIPGAVVVHLYNGSDTKYSYSELIETTTEYQKFKIKFTPKLVGPQVSCSYLAFHGGYGTGVRSTVRNIRFSVAE